MVAVFQTSDKPVHIVVTIEKVFGVKVSSEADATRGQHEGHHSAGLILILTHM